MFPENRRAAFSGDQRWVEDHGYGFVQDYAVLDVRELSDSTEFLSALRASNRNVGCFWPRHALRDPDNHSNYLLVCFECSHIYWSVNGNEGRVHVGAGRMEWNALADRLGMEMPPDRADYLPRASSPTHRGVKHGSVGRFLGPMDNESGDGARFAESLSDLARTLLISAGSTIVRSLPSVIGWKCDNPAVTDCYLVLPRQH